MKLKVLTTVSIMLVLSWVLAPWFMAPTPKTTPNKHEHMDGEILAK
jgi:hypothetical protein